MEPSHWPRIRHLPKADRIPFAEWLESSGKTRPMLKAVPLKCQDGYFHDDYAEWARIQSKRCRRIKISKSIDVVPTA